MLFQFCFYCAYVVLAMFVVLVSACQQKAWRPSKLKSFSALLYEMLSSNSALLLPVYILWLWLLPIDLELLSVLLSSFQNQ